MTLHSPAKHLAVTINADPGQHWITRYKYDPSGFGHELRMTAALDVYLCEPEEPIDTRVVYWLNTKAVMAWRVAFDGEVPEPS